MRRVVAVSVFVLLFGGALATRQASAQDNDVPCDTQPDGGRIRAALSFIEGRVKKEDPERRWR